MRRGNPVAGSPNFLDPFSVARGPALIHNWNSILLGTATLMLFLVVCVVMYLCYLLIEPYLYGIVAAALLSVMIHPSQVSTKSHDECVQKMEACVNSWIPVRLGYNFIGPLCALAPFCRYLINSAARFLGLNKMPLIGRIPAATALLMGLFAVQLSSLWVLLWMCTGLLVVSVIFVIILSEANFVWWLSKVAKVSLGVFFVVFFLYNMSLDVIYVHREVTTRMRSTNIPFATITDYARTKVLEEVSAAFSRSNVTATALELQHTFGPIIGNLSWENDWRAQTVMFYEALTTFAGENVTATQTIWKVAKKSRERWGPLVELLVRIVLSPFVSIVYAFSEAVVSWYVFKFLRGLPNTVLFSVLFEAQSVLHPGSAGQRARDMEQDIVRHFTTLFQSFWHMTVFHFGLSFSVLKWCQFPLPGLCALLGVGAAIFPIGPKFLTSCFVALVAQVFASPLSSQAAVLAGAWMLQYTDEWLLAVRGAKHTGGQASVPPFVVAMTIVCGLMSFGVKGVVLGPLILIVVLTCLKAFKWEALETREPAASWSQDPSDVGSTSGSSNDDGDSGALRGEKESQPRPTSKGVRQRGDAKKDGALQPSALPESSPLAAVDGSRSRTQTLRRRKNPHSKS